MKDGTKPLLFHTIHTIIAFIFVVVSVIFGPCFGFDDVEDYAFFWCQNGPTLLLQIYIWTIIIFAFLFFLLGSLHTVPYTIMYWVKYWRNPGLGNAKKGMRLTAISLLMIIVHPLGTLSFVDMLNDNKVFSPEIIWAVIFVYIIGATYYMPYTFIRLSYPKITQHKRFKKYRIFVVSQLVIYLILIIYVNSPLPEVLSEFMDRKYLHWYHWY